MRSPTNTLDLCKAILKLRLCLMKPLGAHPTKVISWFTWMIGRRPKCSWNQPCYVWEKWNYRYFIIRPPNSTSYPGWISVACQKFPSWNNGCILRITVIILLIWIGRMWRQWLVGKYILLQDYKPNLRFNVSKVSIFIAKTFLIVPLFSGTIKVTDSAVGTSWS